MARKRKIPDARQDVLFELPPVVPLSVEPDPCSSSHGGTPESEEAHASLSGEGKSQAREKLYLVVVKSKRGMTCDELEKITKMRHQTASARVVELLTEGRLVRTARRRQTRSGRMASVMVTKDQWRPEMGLGGRRQKA